MKLPDFAQAVEFIRLRQQMGAISIPTLPRVRFTRLIRKKQWVEEIDKNDKQLLERLRSGIEVSSRDIRVQKGFLTLSGRKIVAYIRDQRKSINEHDRTSDYRFHLWDCATMQSMRRAGRERRYVATQRSAGWFEVNYAPRVFFGPTKWGGMRNATARLQLCQHCRNALAWRGLY